ncbi:MAG TPA: cytidylate kinase-like family protein [Candidatus Sulfotelmatobacter sp.]|nr:cytidylate kinase-like family protein [Candidatus Sulfotelmatobacter sp.]
MSRILNLVERQAVMSNVRARLAAEVPSRPGQYVAEDGTIFGPCLLVSRECGSGGGLAARRAGDLMGWNVFDARIVDEIARNAHVRQRAVQNADERAHSSWERTWRGLVPDDLADERYIRYLREVICELGRHGNVVIVGRGAQYILPPQCAVRVRLVAPLETRAKRVAERRNISLDEARSQIWTVDKQRAEFVWRIFRKEVNSPLNQDMMINTGAVSIEGAAKMMVAALGEKFGVVPPKLLAPVMEDVDTLSPASARQDH